MEDLNSKDNLPQDTKKESEHIDDIDDIFDSVIEHYEESYIDKLRKHNSQIIIDAYKPKIEENKKTTVMEKSKQKPKKKDDKKPFVNNDYDPYDDYYDDTYA